MALFRILLYTTGFGGLGYTLLQIVTPDETKLAKSFPEGQEQYRSEALKKREAFAAVLQGAAEGRDPMYRQTQEQIQANLNRSLGKK